MAGRIQIADYDPKWPQLFRYEAGRIRAALGSRALRIEHTGSTSVPSLAAKPVIDILLVVNNSADEQAYAPVLEAAGYTLRIREPDWHEHRMFNGPDTQVNLHVFSNGCPEIDRILQRYQGRRMAERPSAVGAIPVETTAGGVIALARADCVKTILEDQNILPLS